LPQEYSWGGDLVVPPNSYFGLGDNRDVSYDGRFWGFIPKENVIGYPKFIYWSFITPNEQYLKKDIGDQIKFTFSMRRDGGELAIQSSNAEADRPTWL
jgi:hypothetical protein